MPDNKPKKWQISDNWLKEKFVHVFNMKKPWLKNFLQETLHQSTASVLLESNYLHQPGWKTHKVQGTASFSPQNGNNVMFVMS